MFALAPRRRAAVDFNAAPNLLRRLQYRQRLRAVLAKPMQVGNQGAMPVKYQPRSGQVPLALLREICDSFR
jgi:hypothetical protein